MNIDELADLIAEASRTSSHAEKAYQILRDRFPELPVLEARQRVITNRMKGAL